MAEHSRYNVSTEDEDVLKNKLGITDQKLLQDTETLLLSDTYSHFFDLLKKEKLSVDIDLIFKIHTYFLETLYVWAGKVRKVEISKDGILFCPHSKINNELKNFKQIFQKNKPSGKDTEKTLSEKLSVIHCEFNAIHPFREGNGRTVRLFLDLIAAECGFDVIDYKKTSTEAYIKACIAGMKKDYSKMQKILYKGLCKNIVI